MKGTGVTRGSTLIPLPMSGAALGALSRGAHGKLYFVIRES